MCSLSKNTDNMWKLLISQPPCSKFFSPFADESIPRTPRPRYSFHFCYLYNLAHSELYWRLCKNLLKKIVIKGRRIYHSFRNFGEKKSALLIFCMSFPVTGPKCQHTNHYVVLTETDFRHHSSFMMVFTKENAALSVMSSF